MELQFLSNTLNCMKRVVQEVQNSEQTQELKVSDGMPDVGRVIQAWGQPILRGKEWHGDEVQFSGGMMVWVLYAADGQQEPQVLSSWIPFQMRWDLPSDVPDGDICLSCLTRFVDARSVSPRKIMVRCGMAVLCEAYVPDSMEVRSPGPENGSTEILKSQYPLRVYKSAGEKMFLMDEELAVPDSVPVPKKMIYSTVDGKLQDSRVLADKLVFRGAGKLHLLYCAENGQFHSWDFEMPFSQFAELGDSFGSDAQGELRLAVTNLETELEESGKLRVKCGMVAQYLVSDKENIEVVEDAYSVDRELKLQQEMLTVPVVLEKQKTNLYGEQTVQLDADLAADVRFLPDFPVQRRQGDQVEMTYPGNFQLLYYGSDGNLHGTSSRWEGKETLSAAQNAQMIITPQPTDPQAVVGNGTITMTAELPVERMAAADQSISMVTDIQPGQERQLDPLRPSLILQRTGKSSLWELAKNNDSTIASIRSINQLEGEPKEGQMLLIPVK